MPVLDYAPGSYTFTAPAGARANQFIVELWGSGGTGGPATGNPARAGGGAGGQYVRSTLTLVPGTGYALVVGAAPTAQTSAVVNGNDSTFGGTTVVAKGGAGGANSTGTSGAGGTGSSTSGVGNFVAAGGSGGAGTAGGVSGGGGAAGSQDGAGAAGSAGTAGAGRADSGSGGAGVTTANTNNPGGAYGGGGSGGLASSATDRAGGNGGAGHARITWDTLTLNNYLFIDVGDGQSTSNKIR